MKELCAPLPDSYKEVFDPLSLNGYAETVPIDPMTTRITDAKTG